MYKEHTKLAEKKHQLAASCRHRTRLERDRGARSAIGARSQAGRQVSPKTFPSNSNGDKKKRGPSGPPPDFAECGVSEPPALTTATVLSLLGDTPSAPAQSTRPGLLVTWRPVAPAAPSRAPGHSVMMTNHPRTTRHWMQTSSTRKTRVATHRGTSVA